MSGPNVIPITSAKALDNHLREAHVQMEMAFRIADSRHDLSVEFAEESEGTDNEKLAKLNLNVAWDQYKQIDEIRNWIRTTRQKLCQVSLLVYEEPEV